MDARELPNILPRLKGWKRPVVLTLFNAWTPTPALRHKILVENPAKLYRFSRES